MNITSKELFTAIFAHMEFSTHDFSKAQCEVAQWGGTKFSSINSPSDSSCYATPGEIWQLYDFIFVLTTMGEVVKHQ